MPVHSARKDSERLQRETSRGSCWKKAGGCRGAVAATAPGMPRLWARSKEQNRNMFCSLLFPPPGHRPQGCTHCHLCLLKQTGPWRGPVSPWSPQEWQAARSGSVGPEPRVQSSSCQPANSMDAVPLCWGPYVNVFMRCGQGDSLLAEGSLQKL